MRSKSGWHKRQQATKRAAAIKASLLAKAYQALELLWATGNMSDSGFTSGERKAIADASYEIRSIKGGWINRGRR